MADPFGLMSIQLNLDLLNYDVEILHFGFPCAGGVSGVRPVHTHFDLYTLA